MTSRSRLPLPDRPEMEALRASLAAYSTWALGKGSNSLLPTENCSEQRRKKNPTESVDADLLKHHTQTWGSAWMAV